MQALGGTQHVTYICHDYYYKDLSHLPVEERAKTNFDHPDALETSLLVQQLGRHMCLLFRLLVQPILRTCMRQKLKTFSVIRVNTIPTSSTFVFNNFMILVTTLKRNRIGLVLHVHVLRI